MPKTECSDLHVRKYWIESSKYCFFCLDVPVSAKYRQLATVHANFALGDTPLMTYITSYMSHYHKCISHWANQCFSRPCRDNCKLKMNFNILHAIEEPDLNDSNNLLKDKHRWRVDICNTYGRSFKGCYR